MPGKKIIKKIYCKGKLIVISCILVLGSHLKKAGGMGMPLTPPAPIIRQSTESAPTYARVVVEKREKIKFIEKEGAPLYSNLSKNRIHNVDQIVKLRGGNMDPLAKALFRILVVWAALNGHKPVEGLLPPKMNPSYGHRGLEQPAPRIAPKPQDNILNRNNPGQGGCSAKQNNNDGTLTREQRRNLPSPDDVYIPEQNVVIRDGQARHKLNDHGHDFGIESTQNSRGRFKTARTSENIKAFKEKIKDLVLQGERIEGTYRKGAPDSYKATHFYDRNTRRNVIFKDNQFVSGWELTKNQTEDLLTNGNVGNY